MTVYVLGTICIVLAVLLGINLFWLYQAGKAINQYDEFYYKLIRDFESHLQYLHNLTQNNVVLSTDDDVRSVVKAIQKYYDMLLRFVNDEGEDNEGP